MLSGVMLTPDLIFQNAVGKKRTKQSQIKFSGLSKN